jgi:hypothetical protein
MASTALELVRPDAVSLREAAPVRLLPVPWRDPHSISPTELAAHIRNLEKAVVDNPESADLKTCLGMAYAMDYRAYRSMDVLQAAAAQDPNHFFAQFKLAELFYRLRALPRAEEETLRAVALAGNGWELGMARRQLQEIRQRIREGTQKPEWNKSLKTPAIAFVAVTVCLCLLALLAR